MPLSVRPLLSSLLLLGALLPAATQSLNSQVAPPAQHDRIAAHANLSATTRLAGHVPVWAVAANDAGPASADTPLHLTFVLSRSPEREAAFTQLLAAQQTPGSPSYHHWLTPQQIGTLYGPTQNDLDALTHWLSTQGLTVTDLAPSHTFVTVEAPTSTVANALAIGFRKFTVKDETGRATPRISVTSNPAIPTALAPIVASISGLVDAPIAPDHHIQTTPAPALTNGSGSHNLAPGDFSKIYDINPVYQQGIDGTGQKIAVIGASRVNPSDVTNLQSFFKQPTKLPNTIIPPTGVDPNMTSDAFQGEATIDVDRVIAVAPGAQPDLVVSGTVGATNGIYIASMYAVQTLNDPVINLSFSSCETQDSASLSGISGFWNQLFMQAAAQGISVIVSSGDSGAAQCQAASAPPSGVQARAINDICASGYVTCVGGTEFADSANPTAFWNTTNDANFVSALSYIPEGAWNEPGSTAPFVIDGTGGGVSIFIPKPSWQTGAGVPTDGFRDVPDVSFSASNHDGYVACLAYLGANFDCSKASSTSINATVVGGTSAASPSMAGIAALLNQKTGTRQGSLNPLLYKVAATSPSVFHDATPATSGVVCDIDTPSMCNNSTPSAGALTGGLAGYALTTGYDQATGLGSIDVGNLLGAVVTAESLSLTPASGSLTVQRGATTGNTDVVTLSSLGYGGSVSLGCTVAFNGPGTATSIPICSFSPGTVNALANGSVTSTLTLATTLPQATATVTRPSALPRSKESLPLGRLALCSIFLVFLLPSRRMRRTLRGGYTLVVALLLLGSLGALSACSGASTPASPNPLLISTSFTSVATSAPAIFVGGNETFSAAVFNSGFNNTVAPSGTVNFFQSGAAQPFASATIVNGTATTAPIPYQTAGSFGVYAVYAGDNNFSTSTSLTSSFNVMPLGTNPGSYTVTINATSPSGLTASSTVALTVQ